MFAHCLHHFSAKTSCCIDHSLQPGLVVALPLSVPRGTRWQCQVSLWARLLPRRPAVGLGLLTKKLDKWQEHLTNIGWKTRVYWNWRWKRVSWNMYILTAKTQAQRCELELLEVLVCSQAFLNWLLLVTFCKNHSDKLLTTVFSNKLMSKVMFLNLLLDHDEDLDEQEKRSWQLHTPDSRECPEKLFIFMTGRNGSVQFATVPLKFYGADAKTFFEGKSIYVLKRFATPDLLVLKSCLLCEPPTLAIDGDSTPRYALTSAWWHIFFDSGIGSWF